MKREGKSTPRPSGWQRRWPARASTLGPRSSSKMRERAVHIAGAIVLALSGCGQRAKPSPAPAASTSASPVAVDRLLPGELSEGPGRALGLAVPREMQLERVFD